MLLRPVERELREELIVLNRTEGIDYGFTWGDAEALYRPEFDAARAAWKEFFPGKRRRSITALDQRPCLVESSGGPDRLRVCFDGQETRSVAECFLNINALDFGIEVDRVGLLRLDEGIDDLILLDGELNDHVLLNRPIGLFEVKRFHHALDRSPARSVFRPDILFYSGVRRRPSELGSIISEEFVPRLAREGLRTQQEQQDVESLPRAGQYGLCPVTRQIALRHRQQLASAHALPGPVAHEQNLIGQMYQCCAAVNQIYRPLPVDYGIDAEIEFRSDRGQASGRKIYLQLKSGNAHLRYRHRDSKEVFQATTRLVDYWQTQPCDVYLVIRTDDGRLRWMNVTAYLQGRSNKASTQIVFGGERLDGKAILRVRKRMLG